VAIIGAGNVGATTAYALMLRALFRDIVLIDKDMARAQAEAVDIAHGNALARPARIWAGTYADAATAQIAILTAGAATHGAESRLSVTARSAAIVQACVADLRAAGFDGLLLVAANPVDVMALTAFEHAGLPASRVIGSGTLLDSSRLRQAVAARLGVAPGSVSGYVVGEHGDSEVVAFSTVRVGGLPLSAIPGAAALDLDAIAADVREAAYRIVTGKGYTSFGVATALVKICEAVIRDEKTVLPVSTLLTGQYGISDLYLSLPCIVGRGGVEKVLVAEFNPAETEQLHRSAEVVRQAALGRMG